MFVLYKWAIFYGYVSILVGGFNHLEKIFVNGKDDIPYIMENEKRFETTNQYR